MPKQSKKENSKKTRWSRVLQFVLIGTIILTGTYLVIALNHISQTLS